MLQPARIEQVQAGVASLFAERPGIAVRRLALSHAYQPFRDEELKDRRGRGFGAYSTVPSAQQVDGEPRFFFSTWNGQRHRANLAPRQRINIQLQLLGAAHVPIAALIESEA